MNLNILKCLAVVCMLVFAYSAAASAPDVPWPSQKILGKFHEQISEEHKAQLIKASLKEKYVPGESNFFDIVFDNKYISVDKDGNEVLYSDSAIRANTPEARQAFGEFPVRYNATKESVDFLRAEVYLPDGSTVKTDTSSYRVKEPFTNLVYSDLKVKILTLKGIEEGAILRIIIKRTYHPDVDKGFSFLLCPLDTPVPLKESLTILRLEPQAKIIKKERIHLPSSLLVNLVQNTEAGETYYILGTTDVKPKVPEAASVPSSERDDGILFVSPSTWSDVARWWSEIYEPKISTSKAIKEKAIDLTRNLSSREEKIKALYEYVRSIRYVSIIFGQGAYVPQAADDTLKNKYGDCKDKSVLLLSLLRSIGIDGVVALVRVQGLIDKEMPSPRYFDHAVVALQDQNQSYTFLDATTTLTPYGLLPEAIQYRDALIPQGKGGELYLIPPQSPDMNRVEEAIEADIQDVRTATVTNRSLTLSPKEAYNMIPQIPQPLLLQKLKEGMARAYKDFDIISVSEEPADSKGILKGESKIKIRDFTKRMGSLYIFNPLFDADKLGNAGMVASPERKNDIELDGPKKLIVTTTIRLPASVTVEALPKQLNIMNEKFGSYSYEVSQSPGILRIRREVQIKVKRVSVKDYAEFREFYQTCLNQDEELVGLKKR